MQPNQSVNPTPTTPPKLDDASIAFLDDRDKIYIQQLHEAVSQFSSNCFETKKFCASFLISASVVVITFTNQKIDQKIFIAGMIIVMLFWVLDSYNYYYQEKLRANMNKIDEQMLTRHNLKEAANEAGIPLKPNRRQDKYRWLRALFNHSMLFYYVLIFLSLLAILAFALNIFHPILIKG